MTGRKLLRLVESFWKNMGLTACTLPSPESHKYCLSPHLFRAVSQCYLSAVSSALIFILPPIKLNLQLSCCVFFFKLTQFSYGLSETTVFWFISRGQRTARIDHEGLDEECSATWQGHSEMGLLVWRWKSKGIWRQRYSQRITYSGEKRKVRRE